MNQHTRIYCLLFLLIFSVTACRRGTLTAQQSQDAANAVRQLDRVRVAVSVKSPRNEYDLALDTARRAVNEKLPLLPEGALRQKIAATLDTYADAQKVWAWQDSVAALPSPPPASAEMLAIWTKYDLTKRLADAPPAPTPTPNNGVMPVPRSGDAATDAQARTLIWRAAEQHLVQAKELLTKENRIF